MKTSHVRVRIKVWRTTKIIGDAIYKSVAIMIEKMGKLQTRLSRNIILTRKLRIRRFGWLPTKWPIYIGINVPLIRWWICQLCVLISLYYLKNWRLIFFWMLEIGGRPLPPSPVSAAPDFEIILDMPCTPQGVHSLFIRTASHNDRYS